MSDESSTPESGPLVWQAVQRLAITPERANNVAAQYMQAARKRNPNASDDKIQALVSSKIIGEYAKYTALMGGASALPGIIPGVGTAVAIAGGTITDASLCLKAQVDMTMTLAAIYGWDMTEQNARHMAYLIAVCGGLQRFGSNRVAPIASKAGVRMLDQYLKGATLVTIKELFKAFGITFTKTALKKSIPFGVGAVLGSGINYRLTKYVGKEAVSFFQIARLEPDAAPA